jgi:hypothetical protein
MEIHARPTLLPAMPRRGYSGHQFSDALEDFFSISSISLADLGGE